MSTRVVSELLAGKDRQLFTIQPEATVQEALELMVAKRISALPVAGWTSTIGAPSPPVSQYQSLVSGSTARPSFAWIGSGKATGAEGSRAAGGL